jgi:hypothetical protein
MAWKPKMDPGSWCDALWKNDRTEMMGVVASFATCCIIEKCFVGDGVFGCMVMYVAWGKLWLCSEMSVDG